MITNGTFTILALLAVCSSCVPMFNRKEEYLRELAAIDANNAMSSPQSTLGNQGKEGERILVIHVNNDNLLKKIIQEDENAVLNNLLGENDIVDDITLRELMKKDNDRIRKRALDSIGGGALIGKRALDSIGGGALIGKRALDSIGGGALIGKRALDSIGGGALLGKRSLSNVEENELLEKRALDRIGGGALLGKRFSLAS